MPSPIRVRQLSAALESGGGGIPWLPTDIASAVWWTNAAAGVTTDTGGVSLHEDQTATGLDVSQGTEANRPDYSSTGFNTSYDGITFNGTTDHLTSSSDPGFYSASGAYTVLMACKVNTMPVFRALISEGSTSTTQTYALLGVGSNAAQARAFIDTNGGAGTSSSFSPAIDAFDDSHSLVSVTDNAGTLTLHKDGVSAPNTVSYTAGGTLDTNIVLCVGARVYSGVGNYAPVVIAQTVICTAAISTDDRQRWEGYTAHAVGLTGNLAVDHPYKTEAPTVSADHLKQRLDRFGSIWPIQRDLVEKRGDIIVPNRKLIVPDTGWRLAA